MAIYKVNVLKYKIVEFEYEVEAGSKETAKELVYWGIAEEKSNKELEFLNKLVIKSVTEKGKEVMN